MNFTYISLPCTEMTGLELRGEGEEAAFAIFCHAQFHFLLRTRKIFPKRIIAQKAAWQDLLNGLTGQVESPPGLRSLGIRVPLPKDKLISLL